MTHSVSFEEKLATVLPAINRNYQIQAGLELERQFCNVLKANLDADIPVLKILLDGTLKEWAKTVTLYDRHSDVLKNLMPTFIPLGTPHGRTVIERCNNDELVASASMETLKAGGYPATFAKYPDNVTDKQVDFFYHVHKTKVTAEKTGPVDSDVKVPGVTVETILNRRPEFTFFIRKLPVSSFYLEQPTYWYAGLVPNAFLSFIDKEGVDIDLFAKEMPWFPIVRSENSELTGLLKLQELLSAVSHETVERYIEIVETYCHGAMECYVPSTDCSNAELPITVIPKTIPQLYCNNLFNPQGLRDWGRKNNCGVWYSSAKNLLMLFIRKPGLERNVRELTFIPGTETFSNSAGILTTMETYKEGLSLIKSLNTALDTDEIPSILQSLKGA